MAVTLAYKDGIGKVVLTGTVTKGDAYEDGDVLGVYTDSGVSGDTVGVTFTGGHTLAKATGTAYVPGNLLYWNTTNDNLTTTNTDLPAGIAMEAAASGATTAVVWLHGFES